MNALETYLEEVYAIRNWVHYPLDICVLSGRKAPSVNRK